jgi:hypothetical protein
VGELIATSSVGVPVTSPRRSAGWTAINTTVRKGNTVVIINVYIYYINMYIF